MARRLKKSFYKRDALEVAPDLLNKILVSGECSGRIVEVEAYRGALDPASHGFKGMTARNEVMFGPPGMLYVYFTYGMHYCCNVVCEDEDICGAVLIRSIEPLSGIDLMRDRRRAKSDRDIANGPAKLCQALAIGRQHNGANLLTNNQHITVVDDGTKPPDRPQATARIGLSRGTDLPWRFTI